MAAIGKILDRVITEFSPSRGVQRLRARQQAKVLMNYDAATKGRRAAGWKRTGTDADAAANGSREAIRNLARDFVRNRPYAARYVDVVATNVVGTGIQFSVRHDDLDRAGQIDAVLRQHMGTTDIDARGECDMAQLQRIIIRGVVVDGEILARRRDFFPLEIAGQLVHHRKQTLGLFAWRSGYQVPCRCHQPQRFVADSGGGPWA